MRIKNPFFKKKNNIYIGDIFNILNLKKPKNNFKVDNISDLNSAKTTDLSFFNSLKYIEGLKLTKANNIITDKKLTVPENNETVLINSNFRSGYYIDREKMYQILKFYTDN